MLNKNKAYRTLRVMFGITPGRKGCCKPDECSTLDGKKGNACCKINGTCSLLADDAGCSIYALRPLNCRSFPTSPADLKLVKNCGYYW